MAVVPQEPASDLHGVPPGVVIEPIDSINPFGAGNFWIKARVGDMGAIRQWAKPKSQGQFFSFTLIDESASIRCTAFQEAVDVLFPLLHNGKVYIFGGGSVKSANRKFNNVNNDYELTFDVHTIVINQPETPSIPKIRYNFVPISMLAKLPLGSIVDVLAVVRHEKLSHIVQRAGNKIAKRTIILVDLTESVPLVLWGDDATSWNKSIGTVIAVRQAQMGYYEGVQLGISFSNSIDVIITPDTIDDVPSSLQDAVKLHKWFVASSKDPSGDLSTHEEQHVWPVIAYVPKSFRDCLCGATCQNIEVLCTIVEIKPQALVYDACPSCHKKVVNSTCPQCNQQVISVPQYKLEMTVHDGTETQATVTVFREVGTKLFRMPPAALQALTVPQQIEVVHNLMMSQVLLQLRAEVTEHRSDGRLVVGGVVQNISHSPAVSHRQKRDRDSDNE